jgi:hypothetical protein
MEDAEVNAASGETKIKPAEVYRRRLRVLCDIMVVSVNGETDNAKKWDLLRSLEADEWSVVQDALNAATAGSTGKKK